MATSFLEQVNFGNEAGDDMSKDELESSFVKLANFETFLESTERFLVATARKGVGKSALLRWTEQKTRRDPNALVIFATGADLERSRFGLVGTPKDQHAHVQDWMLRLCALANRGLAQELKLPTSDDQATLVDTAILDGFKGRSLALGLAERLLPTAGKSAPTRLRNANEYELLRRINERQIWLLVDDLDATFHDTPVERLALSTFFTSCRYLVRDIKGLNIRVSVRTDVWSVLRRDDEALDKVQQYTQEIQWSEGDFLSLLALRIKSSTGGSAPTAYLNYLNRVFVPEMQWGDSRRIGIPQTSDAPPRMIETYKVIYKIAYERPRWAIQLCKLAREAALRNERSRIDRDSIVSVWAQYGVRRIADLVAEHKHQCPEIEELVNTFRGAERQMTREELFQWITNRIGNHLDPLIDGRRTRQPTEIARFLYRMGFILARSVNPDGGYEHYRFDEMPDFLSGRSSDDFGVIWEIHPCYREALQIKKLNRSHHDARRAKARAVRDGGGDRN